MRRAAVLFAVIWFGGGVAGQAKADGTIILNNTGDFQAKIDDQSISGIGSGPTSDPQQRASQSALIAAFPTNTVAPAATASNIQLNGLLSYNPSAGGSGEQVSGWTYGYHIDPDLTDYTIHLRLYLPQVGAYQDAQSSGINTVTIALTSVATDVNHNPVYSTRAWSFDKNLDPNLLTPDAATHLEDFSLFAVQGAGAGGSNVFKQDTGFDIHNVWYLSIGYRGVLGGSYPLSPLGTNSFWAGTQSLNVTPTPEPNSALVLACCLAGTGLVRTALRARSRRLR